MTCEKYYKYRLNIKHLSTFHSPIGFYGTLNQFVDYISPLFTSCNKKVLDTTFLFFSSTIPKAYFGKAFSKSFFIQIHIP
jgi:hypothetical protein